MRHELDFVFLIFLLFLIGAAFAGNAFSKSARTVRLDDKRIERVCLVVGKTTVLNFITKPNKVILGNRGLFAVEYVDNDVAIAPLAASAHSNLFVYVEGRRYAFDLSTASHGGDEIVIVRDYGQIRIPVKLK